MVVATLKPYRQDQPDPEVSVHQQDPAASKAEVFVVASVAHVAAFEAASVAIEVVSVVTEAVLVAEEASATKAEVALEDDPMASVVAQHPLQTLHPVQVVVAAVAWDLVGMVEVRTVAHP